MGRYLEWNAGRRASLARLDHNFAREGASFSEKGVPFDVRCTKMTLTAIYFGDRTHYSAMLTKIGDATASVRVHGHDGFVAGSLIKR